MKALAHGVHDAFELALSEQAVVDEDADYGIAQRLVTEACGDGGIHPASFLDGARTLDVPAK